MGGARSGKSARAQALAEQAGLRRIYLATAEARDSEMQTRIIRHRADRGTGWLTIEEPIEIAGHLGRDAGPETAILVDCLTLWLSNLFERAFDIDAETSRLVAALADHPGPVILVSNEIGLSLVPETALGRAFREAQGRLNQRMAQACERVEFMVAHCPIVLKGKEHVRLL